MGFFEILLIVVVTLLVVGPERMPEAVRSVALAIGRVKRLFNNARADLEKQIGADDIRLQLHNEAVMDSLEKLNQSQENNPNITAESSSVEENNIAGDVIDNSAQSDTLNNDVSKTVSSPSAYKSEQ